MLNLCKKKKKKSVNRKEKSPLSASSKAYFMDSKCERWMDKFTAHLVACYLLLSKAAYNKER